MALSLVDEFDDDLLRELPPVASHRTSQGARGAGPHAPHFDRAQTSPRPAAAFPTEAVIAVLGAIGAVLGARLALFLAGLGIFLLGQQAANGGSIYPMVAFGAFVVLPLVWLSSQRNL